MLEEHHVAGIPRGEPLPPDAVGVRIRVPLTGTPSARWSRIVSARLVAELAGHPQFGHLRLDRMVQGAELVLEAVEASEADSMGAALARAIQAANRAVEVPDVPAVGNVSREEAERIAQRLVVPAGA